MVSRLPLSQGHTLSRRLVDGGCPARPGHRGLSTSAQLGASSAQTSLWSAPRPGRHCVRSASSASWPDRSSCAIPLPPFLLHKNPLQSCLHTSVCFPENAADSQSSSRKPAAKTWCQDWLAGHHLGLRTPARALRDPGGSPAAGKLLVATWEPLLAKEMS